MTALHSDLSADVGYWRKISIYANTLVSVRIGERRDIRVLCWCPGVVVFPLYCSLHIFYKQPQRILPIWNVLQCNFCLLAGMSGVDVNGDEVPHDLDTDLGSS